MHKKYIKGDLMNIAVILAGGVGSRFGAKIPKQFVEVFGKPVLAYTIESFEKHDDIDAILVVCVKPYMDYIMELKNKYGFSKLKWVTHGGATFQESVMNGVNYLKDKAAPDDIVLFHFGASPFIREDIITDVIKVCKRTGTNAISTTDFYLLSGKKNSLNSVSDTNNFTNEYINRDSIAVMNTPHAFKYQYIVDVYDEAVRTGVLDKVEPHTTTLMYAMGKTIYFSKGSQSNIKITNREDLDLFEGYILEQQRKSQEKTSGDVIVFLADGFEEGEGLLVVDILRRAKLKVIMASIMNRMDVKSSRNILITADCLVEHVDFESAKMIVLPGGRLGTENLWKSDIVKKQCVSFAKNKMVAAICAAPSILASLGLLEGKKAAVHPDYESEICGALLSKEPVAVDGNIITSRGLGTTIPFALKLIEELVNSKTAIDIANSICWTDL